MEARDKKILIQSVSAVLIIIVLFNVYSGQTVSKVEVFGLLGIEYDSGNKTDGDNGMTGGQQIHEKPGSTTDDEQVQDNGGPPLVNDNNVRDISSDINQPYDEEVNHPVQPNPIQPDMMDLNGTWYGDDGSEYEISQSGGSVFFTEYGMFGETARGSGSYQNNRVVFEYETIFGTFGTATLNVSQNGRVLSGRADDMTSGTSTQLYLTRY